MSDPLFTWNYDTYLGAEDFSVSRRPPLSCVRQKGVLGQRSSHPWRCACPFRPPPRPFPSPSSPATSAPARRRCSTAS
ncbi:hypothetical protein KL86PLE_80011 [uncultured Pleomorphomonas sp.]|uniref:Uncharacterized protein n=1 Tax=uncultured Pleomorphomonas sp. TaxID=442121 RepID=A0A212LM21_9HYPH|nr:hypothetical protein KL86PLE_80011 [uncultured Pleomorphomonas sp.]